MYSIINDDDQLLLLAKDWCKDYNIVWKLESFQMKASFCVVF